MGITAQQVKELRNMTGIGMMECKKALMKTDGDIDGAVDELRKKGIAKAAKKSDRETLEGAIKITTDGKKAYILSISCETDFLANSDKFKNMLEDILLFLEKNGISSKEDAQDKINKEYTLELGENLKIKEYNIISGATVSSYVHLNGKLASVVISKKDDEDIEKLKQVAMHVTAFNPEYLNTDDISDEVVEKEKSIQLEIMKNDENMKNKSDDVLGKIVGGRMNKFKSEISLLEQGFVADPNIKVKDFIGSDSIESFYRFSV